MYFLRRRMGWRWITKTGMDLIAVYLICVKQQGNSKQSTQERGPRRVIAENL